MKIAVDFLVLPLLLSFAAAFTCPATTGRRSTVNSWSLDSAVAPTSTSAIAEDEETWYRAIQLADSRTTNVEECERLAAQLESVEDCQYEAKDSDTCDTEVSDRQELANILRLKVELKQRLDRLQTSNIFVEDVLKEHRALERQRFKEALIAHQSGEEEIGSDLGLW